MDKMEKIVKQGRVLLAVAIVAFGIENLICTYLKLTVRGVPWYPHNPFLGYVAGAVFITAGVCIAISIRTRLTAMLMGILFLFCTLLLELPVMVARPMDLGIRSVFFEGLALGASALTLAASLSAQDRRAERWDRLLEVGPYLFGVSSIVFGIDHFLILAFIAFLVPAWMPWHMFWAYFTGAGFIAAGISIVIRKLDQWGAFWLGTMFLLWFLLLHAPRVLIAFRAHDPNSPAEWSSAFIALGMSGGSWIVAHHAQQRRVRPRT
jgi:uncharacterized membrane protein